MDERFGRWWFAVLALSLAAITVIGIPLLAPRDGGVGTHGGWPLGPWFRPVVAEALAIVGLLWMVRILRAGSGDEPSGWRYRDGGAGNEPPADDLRDAPLDVRPLEDTRARGWLLARLELTLGALAALAIPALELARPGFVGNPGPPSAYESLLPIAGEIVILLALAWMVRIWRGPLREQPPPWRYRDG